MTERTSYDELLASGRYEENPEIPCAPVEAFIGRWQRHGYLMEPAQQRMYASVAKRMTGLMVCDVGSGAGLGSLVLAQDAKLVVGVEIVEAGARFASRCYPAKNLEFVCAGVAEFAPGLLFDAAVAVELIEHIADYHGALAAIRRLLVDDGVLYISSPNRNAPSIGAGKPRNRHHVREWTIGEFHEILALYFRSVAFYDHTLETCLEAEATLTPVLAVCRK